jgi:hypothetical protein
LIGNTYTQNVGNVMDYNVFYAPAGIDDSEWEWKGVTYTGFAAFTTTTGNDAHSLFIDPQFADPTSSNLHLQSTSPAIDKGENLANMGDYDIDGQARMQGGQVDVGADEYSSATFVYLPLVLGDTTGSTLLR